MIKFIGWLLGYWLISTTIFTMFGAVMVFDSGDWSKLIPFMWGQGSGRALFGLFLFVISPVIALVSTCESKSGRNNHKASEL